MTTAFCGCGCRRGCVDGNQMDVYNNPDCACKSNAWHKKHDKPSPAYRGGHYQRKRSIADDIVNAIGSFFGIGD